MSMWIDAGPERLKDVRRRAGQAAGRRLQIDCRPRQRHAPCTPMKIDQLPIGTRFQWKGRSYTKVGPMTAAADSGGVDFIPKHAALQPIPGEAPPPVPPPFVVPAMPVSLR